MPSFLRGLLLILSLASPSHAQTLPMLAAHWGNLERDWLFRTDPADTGEKEGWQKPEYEERGWRTIHVPGYWEQQGVTDPRPGQKPKPKDKVPYTDYDGVAWYRLHFTVPAEWRSEELVLTLGSVDDEDRTWLNGELIGATGPGIARAVSVHRRYTVPASRVKFDDENVLAIRVMDGGGPGGLMGPFLTLLPRSEAEKVQVVPQSNRPLTERFANPSADARILKIIHGWPDAADDQLNLTRQLLAQGFGGVVCNVSFSDYLVSEARWADFSRAVKAAKSAGMAMWLYDEKGYPSGSAGGLTIKDHPEYEARGLLISDAASDGGAVDIPVPPGKLLLASAYPVKDGRIDIPSARDLTGSVKDGRLRATLPAGKWHVVAITEDRLYEGTHAALSLADKIPCINLLEREPTARFLEVTHEQYARYLGDDLGVYFQATFTDEPSLMSMFLKEMPWRVLPWGPSLSTEFRKRRGFAIEPLLPAVVADAGPESAKARYAFWLTVGELVSENYFGQIQTWCRAHNLPSGGHLLYEEPLLHHVPLYGDFFRCARRLDAPSIDCLTSVPAEVPWYIARLIGSAADLEGRSLTMCETSDFSQNYRPAGDNRPARQVTEDEIRGTCNRLILGGINTITSYYRFGGLHTEQLRRLNEYVGRCCEALRGGKQVTDIAVLYPIESVWPRFVPAHRGATDSPTARQVESAYRTAIDSLYATGRDFAFIDARTLMEGEVAGGELSSGGMSWRVLVLPCVDTLPMAAWENLARFVKGGGIVVALTAKPANSDDEFPSARVQALAEELMGSGENASVYPVEKGACVWLPPGTESLLPAMLDRTLQKDVRPSDPASSIRYTHRRIDGQEVYFLINDRGSPWSGQVSLSVQGAGELWDPSSGRISPIPSGDSVAIDLPAYGGVVLRFAAAREPALKTLASGSLPALSRDTLPPVASTIGAGEFVRGSLTKEGTRWRALGTITKSQTDTFLFLVYRYSRPLDLAEADGLAIHASIPQGQTTPSNLLVIVHEKDGGDFVANTGRTLAQAGPSQLIVPWSRFELAGWSKDSDGRLDTSRIERISIGWGGYYGKEGEKVEFSVEPPEAVRIR